MVANLFCLEIETTSSSSPNKTNKKHRTFRTPQGQNKHAVSGHNSYHSSSFLGLYTLILKTSSNINKCE